ncbi:ABC transporter substrate-binding protein [Dactylosporangium sp. AC04546]|uniref:ABC transporter substrate-binding protein n=1 Tax=Dactylosporangium sp. AC04546 TaxID=2862460 RepID=UPI001EDD1AC2|nr:ABC transporter substrate-binding protein [Dactylosporangium sp. AC04546]WVK86873.1 ABC transporter substrate-binding protein [Dactylosporangium sp. AC04546]
MQTHISSGRRLVAASVALVLSLNAAACGGDDPAGDPSSATAGAGYPVSVNGAYGGVTVKSRPARVVALNPQVGEILVALGVQPVAVAASDKEIAETYPWLKGVFTGTLDPSLLENYEAKLEKIATYRPDLIVGSSYNVTDKAYTQATSVAPTFAGLKVANDDWDDTTRALATLVGADAKPVVDGVEQACTAARQKVPGLAGKTYQWVAVDDAQFRFGNGTWLECFGLKPAANQDNTQSTNAAVSQERIEELNADVLALWDFSGQTAKVKADPRYAKLPSVAAGTVIWTDIALATATNSPGPRSYPYMIERVLPTLEQSASSR